MQSRQNGFTLIEILVVVSILGVLMGLVSMLVMRSAHHEKKTATTRVVKTLLPVKIDRYAIEFRRLPPMSVKELGEASERWKGISGLGNQTNECCEVLLVALRHPDFTTPLGDDDLGLDTPFTNTDDDDFDRVPDGSSSARAREACDSWGNPIVYISKNHYGEPVTIVNSLGDEVEVIALKKPDGTYYNASKYQIISVGENGVQDLDDPESGDDIRNFKLEEE